jgi:hypothetical protein
MQRLLDLCLGEVELPALGQGHELFFRLLVVVLVALVESKAELERGEQLLRVLLPQTVRDVCVSGGKGEGGAVSGVCVGGGLDPPSIPSRVMGGGEG